MDKARLMVRPEYFKKTGIKPGIVGHWEENKRVSDKADINEIWGGGMRTTREKGNFERWYFNTHLKSGTVIVVTYFTKNASNININLKPFISIVITRTDGSVIKKERNYKNDEFSVSKKKCSVNIRKNYFRGDLEKYKIHFEGHELILHINLERTSENCRPKTGHTCFGKEQKSFFAWVVAVSQDKAKVTFIYKRKQKYSGSGSCYRDHSWRNTSMEKLLNHWYWSRTQLIPYTIIAAEMIAEKKYNNENIEVFNVSKDGKTITDDADEVKFYRTYAKLDKSLGKDTSDDLVFIYDNPNDEYRYEYFLNKERIIDKFSLLKSVTGNELKYYLIKLINGYYFRFIGKSQLLVYKKKKLVDKQISTVAVWKLMYFGNRQ